MLTKKLILSIFVATAFVSSGQQNALDFDGTDDRVNCGNSSSVQITGTAFTMEAWVYAHSWKTNVWEGCIITKENYGTPGGYMLRAGSGGKLNVTFGNGSSWNELVTSGTVLSLNTWHHVAGTYDGSKLRLYVDGTPVDSMNATTSVANTTYDLIIGDYPNMGRNWDGKIDEVRVWNVNRTKAQILASMDSTFCGAQPGLVAYYKFNQGLDGAGNMGETTLYDLSGNGNDGVLSGFALNGSSSNWVAGKTLAAPGGAPTTSTTLSVCEQYVSPSGNYVWTTSGVYVDTLASVTSQCDSIVTYNLTVEYGPTGQDSVSACEQYVSPYTGQVITATGTFVDNVPSPLGCDSLITTEVTILDVNSSSVISDSVCSPVFSYVSPSGNHIWTAPGIYNDTLMHANGCESVTVFIAVYNPTINVTVNGQTLSTPAASTATYQWLDCDNGNAPIAGATGQTYTATANGNYAVVVTKSGCSDTSACAAITGVGMHRYDLSDLTVYPNPTNGSVQINFGGTLPNATVSVLDVLGNLVQEQTVRGVSQLNLDLDHPQGVYFIRIQNEGADRTIRIVLNR